MERRTMSRRVYRAMVGGCTIAGIAAILLEISNLRNAQATVQGTVVIVVAFLLVVPTFAYLARRRYWALIAVVITFNIAMFWLFFYFIDFYTSYVMTWIIPLLISYAYFGWWAFTGSALLLVLETESTFYVNQAALRAAGELQYMFILSHIALLGVIAMAIILVFMITDAKRQSLRLTAVRHEEQIQLNRLNTLLNSLSDVVLTLNRYGRITSQNSAALSFLDTNESLIGKGIDSLLPIVDSALKPVSIRLLANDLKKSIVRDDVSWQRDDGVMRLSLQISPIRGIFDGSDREDEGAVVILRDITRQKTLEDEKDEFISVTSHELRTPIAIAEGSLGNLGLMFDKHVPEEKLRASVEAAHDQILYLARMINDLSTLSRAERGVGDTTEEIDINQMLQELYLRYQSEAEAKSLRLDLDLDKLPHVNASKLYLEEILQNFITNAIKYTREGSVTIHGKMVNGRITCSVSDTGIGISKSDQEKIFEKFFRSEDYRTRETSGTGLGLYVVEKLAVKLGTTIEVESRLNHGSTFSFVLPITSKSLDVSTRIGA